MDTNIFNSKINQNLYAEFKRRVLIYLQVMYLNLTIGQEASKDLDLHADSSNPLEWNNFQKLRLLHSVEIVSHCVFRINVAQKCLFEETQ